MPDSSWDTYTPEPRRWRFGGRLLLAVGVIALALATLIAAMVSFARRNHGSAWRIARAVVERLRTDEGARELYRANPVLADAYPTEEAFLEPVRALRGGLRLPEREPAEGREYRVSTSPFDLGVQVKGEGGTWMALRWEPAGPFREDASGEGIRRLTLAPEASEVRRIEQDQRKLRREHHWARFASTARILAGEDGLRQLQAGGARLRTEPSDPAAFAALLRRRSAALRELPADSVRAKDLAVHSRRNPFRSKLEVSATLADGGFLRLTWNPQDLAEIELR